MRSPITVFASLVAVLSFFAFALANNPAAPVTLHQMERRELVVRAKYPELYAHTLAKRTSPGAEDTTSSGCRKVKRSMFDHPDEVLDASEVAAFLIGGGRFTYKNGTQYHDFEFSDDQAGHKRKVNKRSKVHNIVRRKLASYLEPLTLPHYRRWRDGAAIHSDAIMSLTPYTGFRVRDIHAIERSLLADPHFEAVQFHGFVITRRFLEAVDDLYL
ncbi:hypothetical protein FRB97_001770 [Tulasnella sp. 331]|nr:hypothetical protein FRB97_001770 [Tulasnella sp. 331]